MNDQPDSHMSLEQMTAAKTRRLRVLQGDPNPSPTAVVLDAERAVKLWKWIPRDQLQATIDHERAAFGTRNVTLEKVAEAWLKRHRKLRPSAEERSAAGWPRKRKPSGKPRPRK